MVTSDLEETGRVSTSGGIQAGLAGRYATALFGLARDNRELDAVEGSIAKLHASLDESEGLRTLTRNPVLSRAQSENAVAAVVRNPATDHAVPGFWFSDSQVNVAARIFIRGGQVLGRAEGDEF